MAHSLLADGAPERSRLTEELPNVFASRIYVSQLSSLYAFICNPWVTVRILCSSG